jgi:phosphate transport system permease protein
MTLADDALQGVPGSQRRAARALGLTRAETTVSVVLPQAWGGLVAALLLGLGRALGETIAVFLVVGRQDNQWPEKLLSLRPLAEPGQTLTSKLGGSETFLAFGDPLHWAAMMGLAVVLLGLVMTVTRLGFALGHSSAGRSRSPASGSFSGRDRAPLA